MSIIVYQLIIDITHNCHNSNSSLNILIFQPFFSHFSPFFMAFPWLSPWLSPATSALRRRPGLRLCSGLGRCGLDLAPGGEPKVGSANPSQVRFFAVVWPAERDTIKTSWEN
jgi:hypothetical protein